MTTVIGYTDSSDSVIQAGEVLRRASIVLNDTEEVRRWPVSELLLWLNDGITKVVELRPAEGARLAVVPLVAGTRQDIPEGGRYLMDAPYNVTSDDSIGRAVSLVDRSLLDSVDPDWPSRRGAGTIKHYMTDDRDPKRFYVYPPAMDGAKLLLSYMQPPDPIVNETDEFTMDRSLIPALVSYILYRALAKDSEYANGAVAAAHINDFYQSMGVSNEVALTAGPKGPMNEES